LDTFFSFTLFVERAFIRSGFAPGGVLAKRGIERVVKTVNFVVTALGGFVGRDGLRQRQQGVGGGLEIA
jgi:hypothetical protein